MRSNNTYRKTIVILVTGLSLSLGACTPLNGAENTPNKYNYTIAVNQPSVEKTTKVTKQPAMEVHYAPSLPPTVGGKSLEGEDAVRRANTKSLHKPKTSRYINSTMTFDYVDGALYQVYCAPLRVTDVQFQSNEHIVSVGAGDTLRWQVSRTYSGNAANRQEHLLVKPIDTGLVNSLVVTTDQRTYHLTLYSTPDTYMVSVAWHYADSDGLLTNLGEGPQGGINAETEMTNLDINNLDFRFKTKLISGPMPDWYPTAVFHDSHKTYIKFSSGMQEAPTLFVGNNVKTNQLVNYRMVGNYYVIDGLFQQAQLRSGQGKQIVVQITYGK